MHIANTHFKTQKQIKLINNHTYQIFKSTFVKRFSMKRILWIWFGTSSIHLTALHTTIIILIMKVTGIQKVDITMIKKWLCPLFHTYPVSIFKFVDFCTTIFYILRCVSIRCFPIYEFKALQGRFQVRKCM